jgi:phage recombination protein Bet
MTQEIEKLRSLTPEGYDVADYARMVNTQLMGTDKTGKSRPYTDMIYFLSVCKKLKLDPLARQVYPVYRWNSIQGREVMAIQTSIDGQRLTAQRSGDYAGQDDAVFEEQNGQPIKATVTVYKMVESVRCPVTASARFSEYNQEMSPVWKKLPYAMLAKVAESLALRKAFPQELSGIYTTEEMDQAQDRVVDSIDVDDGGNDAEAKVDAVVDSVKEIVAIADGKVAEPSIDKKGGLLAELAKVWVDGLGKDSDELLKFTKLKFSDKEPEQLSELQLTFLIKALQGQVKLRETRSQKVEDKPVESKNDIPDDLAKALGENEPTFDKGGE